MDQVDRVLATIITAPLDAMVRRIDKIVGWMETNDSIASVIAGIHVEGPFISPKDGFAGAHPKASVLMATEQDAGRLLVAAAGHLRILTLAPEQDPGASVTRFLTKHRVTVAAGHSDASLEELKASADAGLRLYTHLGNACPSVVPRHDNIIQRVLSVADRIAISFIADGHHIPMFALGNYLRCVPQRHIIIVSDAISAAGLGPGEYPLSGQTVFVDESGAAWSESRTHYAGCATPLKRMKELLNRELGVGESTIDEWMGDNPRRLLGSF